MIKEQKMGEINVSSSVTLTKPYGSSQVTNANLVWTILPLIKLPHNQTPHKRLHERLKYLGIVLSPSVEHVISNLRNLSTSILILRTMIDLKSPVWLLTVHYYPL